MLNGMNLTKVARTEVAKDLAYFELRSELISKKSNLSLGEQLWYQAYGAFLFLSPEDNSDRFFEFDSELRRFIFNTILKGEASGEKLKITTDEGEVYECSKLDDGELIKKMVKKLKECYSKANRESHFYVFREILGWTIEENEEDFEITTDKNKVKYSTSTAEEFIKQVRDKLKDKWKERLKGYREHCIDLFKDFVKYGVTDRFYKYVNDCGIPLTLTLYPNLTDNRIMEDLERVWRRELRVRVEFNINIKRNLYQQSSYEEQCKTLKSILNKDVLKLEGGGALYLLYDDETIINTMVVRDIIRYIDPISVPKNLKRYLEGDSEITRETLFGLLFVLRTEIEWDEMEKFIKKVPHIQGPFEPRQIVPRDLVWLYCSNGIMTNRRSWIEFLELAEFAELIFKDPIFKDSVPPIINDVGGGGTPTSELNYFNANQAVPYNEDECERHINYLEEAIRARNMEFIRLLCACCKEAVRRIVFSNDAGIKQYSLSAWSVFYKKVLSKLIRNNLKSEQKQKVEVVYSKILRGYFSALNEEKLDVFPDTKEEYSFPVICDGGVTQSMFHRFFSYRTSKPIRGEAFANGDHVSQFSGDNGKLHRSLHSLCTSLARFQSIEHDGKVNISRSDILNFNFYSLLMSHWKDEYDRNGKCNPKIEKYADLVKDFSSSVEGDLSNCGYCSISDKNSCDVLFKFVLNSHYPLEIYTRIFELNVISDYFEELKILVEAYKKLQSNELGINGNLDKLRALIEKKKGCTYEDLASKGLEKLKKICDKSPVRKRCRKRCGDEIELGKLLKCAIGVYMGRTYPSGAHIGKILNALKTTHEVYSKLWDEWNKELAETVKELLSREELKVKGSLEDLKKLIDIEERRACPSVAYTLEVFRRLVDMKLQIMEERLEGNLTSLLSKVYGDYITFEKRHIEHISELLGNYDKLRNESRLLN